MCIDMRCHIRDNLVLNIQRSLASDWNAVFIAINQ
jgi:hypothetical protein